MENIITYKNIIQQKLRTLEKKFMISYRSASSIEKRQDLQKYISVLENLFRKLEANILVWEDLQRVGITKKSIFELAKAAEKHDATEIDFSNYEKISSIPESILVQSDLYQAEKINNLYSIIEFININYQTIFTQKILISASKTNGLRELFYMQYQEIFHIFHSYKSYVLIPSTSDDHLKMIDKEYVQLLKAIYSFLVSIQNYIDLIFKDDTFTFEDFIQPIKTTDKNSYIYEYTLREALNQCNDFVTEAIEYIQADNRDIFDYLSMDSKFRMNTNK